MNDNYLIPANTKKGQLWFGIFKPLDAAIFGTGVGITLLLLLIFQNSIGSVLVSILVLLPALVAGFLVLPVAYYHNMRTFIMEIYKYFTNRNRFLWKGWCYKNESEGESK